MNDDTLLRRCSKCKQEKTATPEMFMVDNRRKGGLSSWCKECHRKCCEDKRRSDGVSVRITFIAGDVKPCTKCGKLLPFTVEYYPLYKPRNGEKRLRLYCIDCHRAYSRNRHRQLMETDSSYKSQRKHYDQEAKSDPVRMESRRAAERIRYHFRYDNDPEYKSRIKQKNAGSYCKGMIDPDYRARRKASSNRRRALIKTASGSHTEKDILNQHRVQKGLCWWCGCELSARNYHADHLIPLSRGGSNDSRNIVISCPRCNLSKKDKLPYEWNGRLI